MGLFFARNEAKKIWEKYINNDQATDVESIARAEGLKIHKGKLEEGVSGILVVDKGNSVIFVNESEIPTRQRFTIAHEIGHFLLHKPEGVHVDKSFSVAFRNLRSSSGEESQEIEANQFAAELLMPSTIIEKKYTKGVSISDKDVETLADFFQVSQQAMTIRLTSLGYI